MTELASTMDHQDVRQLKVDEFHLAMGRLTQLASTPGVSGREEQVAGLIADQISPFVDSVAVDSLGNIMATREGCGPTLMLEAHMDEVGFMVKSIEESGFIRFLPVGPILEPPIVGQRMQLHTATTCIDGVVGYDKECTNLYFDTGFAYSDVTDMVTVGDVLTFNGGVTRLGSRLIAGKAMDNRTGVFALIEAARNLSKQTLPRKTAFCFSTRHEIGALGIPALVSAVKPRQAVVVDVALASDYPHGMANRIGMSALHGGPVLWRGVDLTEALHRRLVQLSSECSIPFQIAAWNAFTPTNASHVTKIGCDVQTSLISIPHRYPHGPCSVIATDDLLNTILMLEALARSRQLLDICPA
jgi:putative aminopeptidase FrvX